MRTRYEMVDGVALESLNHTWINTLVIESRKRPCGATQRTYLALLRWRTKYLKDGSPSELWRKKGFRISMISRSDLSNSEILEQQIRAGA